MALCTSPLCFYYFCYRCYPLCEPRYRLSLDVIGANVSCFSPPTRGSFIERWWYPLRVVSSGSHGSDLLSTAATTQMPHRSIRHPLMIKLWYLYHKCITHTKPTLSNRPDGPAEGLASEMMRQYTVAPDNRIGRAPLVGVAMLSDPDGITFDFISLG